MRNQTARARARGPGWLVRCAGALLLAALPLQAADETPGPTVTGPVYYGEARGATKVGEVAIRLVYAENPAFIRLRALGLSESDGGRGQALFDAAQVAAKRALARVANDHELDLIVEIGGVSGADGVVDRTGEVVEQLPHFHVEGKVLHGSERNARQLAEIDSLAVLMTIPSFVEAQALDESNARFHILQKDYQDRFAAALRKTARDGNYDVLVEKGAATSRFGAILDVTQQTITALSN